MSQHFRVKKSEPLHHTASAIIACGLIMTLTFGLWPWKLLHQRPLTW